MKRKMILMISSILCLSFAWLVAAQIIAKEDLSPSAFLPEGALVYAETEDLNHLLTWWKESDLRKNWEQSSNYSTFSNSRLYLKGQDRAGKWGFAADFQLSLDRLISMSGKKSGLALYDIGNLKGILITRVSSTQVEAGELWAARQRFRQESTASVSYFVEPEDGRLCFAHKDSYLLVSSDEDLLRRTLDRMEDASRPAGLENSDKWTALHNMDPASGVLSLYLDMEVLRENRYMKRYWIHRNVSDFKSIDAAWITVNAEKNQWTETRYFLPPTANAADRIPIREWIRPLTDVRFETIFAEGNPDPAETARQILKFVNRLPQPYWKASYPPPFSGAAERASQTVHTERYVQQIDAPIPEEQSAQLWKAEEEPQLTALLQTRPPRSSIRIAYPNWGPDALFARFESTIILQLPGEMKNDADFLNLLRQHFLKLHSTTHLGAEWEKLEDATWVLHSFHPLFVRFQPPWLMLSNNREELVKIAERLPDGSRQPTGFYGEVNWETGRWKYSRMMRRLDHEREDSEEPLFFSQNINSLLQVLEPIHRTSLKRDGSVETVTYQLQ